jgi:hypothetical protein
MTDFLTQLVDALPPGTLWIIAIVSVVAFIGTLLAIPFVLVRLPHDYFDVRVPRTWMKDRHPALRFVGLTVKNVLGLVFLLAGLAMLLIPGQGLLTMLIGITLLDFPGKQRLEASIIGRPKVFRVVNDLRVRLGKAPFVLEPVRERGISAAQRAKD